MKILVTANKGGVGCSSIAYLVGMLFPNRQMYSNDPWHIPDIKIIQLISIDDCVALDAKANGLVLTAAKSSKTAVHMPHTASCSMSWKNESAFDKKDY